MAVAAADVKALRERTGAAMMDCKAALDEAGGDIDKAIELLRVKGQASAAKRSGEGHERGRRQLLHPRGRQGRRARRGPMRDRLRRSHDDFQEFAREVAIHIAAAAPQYVSIDDIPAEQREAERRVFEEKAREEASPTTSSRRSSRASSKVGFRRRAARAGARADGPLRGQHHRADPRRGGREHG